MCGGAVFVHVRACVKISVCRWLWRVSKISFKITSQGRKLTVGTEIETGFKKGCLKNFLICFSEKFLSGRPAGEEHNYRVQRTKRGFCFALVLRN